VIKVLTSVAFICVSIYLGVAGYMYLFQRDYLYFPDTRRPAADLAGIASLQEVELLTSDGLRLLAWYLPPVRGNPVVLYFHGNAGNIGNRASRLAHFADAQLGVLMPEYRGYGGNEGQPTEAGLYADAAAAMNFLVKEGIAPTRIVIYGESLGAGVATQLASERDAAALILEAPYTSITAIAAPHYWFLPVGLMLKDRFDSLSRIAQVRAPLLIIQGERDQVVPPEHGRELFAAAPEPKQFWVASEGGHEDLYEHGAGNIVLDFLRRHVRTAK
jgi:uncharacterized protein